jgi:NADP-dependent 3-hydroxy acid dehydrogenase YdfG
LNLVLDVLRDWEFLTMKSALAQQTILITGGGSGIGWATAQQFAAAGARVIIGGRDEAKLRAATATWTGSTPIGFKAVNVAERASVNEFVKFALDSWGQIDILVNAAGVNIKHRTMGEMQPEQWDEVMAINATGAYNAMHAVLPGMRQRKSGMIINISSVAGKRAMKLGGIAYDASKFAMTALGTAVGQEEAPNNIRVTNIYPGEVDTPILVNRPTPITEEHRARILLPDDVAAIIVFLAQQPARAHVPELVIKPLLQDYC